MIVDLAERLCAPVVTTFKAKGQISDQHPNAAGVLGRSGTPIASWFMAESDLIIALGSSFSNHTGIEKKKPILQVDFEAMQLGKFHRSGLSGAGRDRANGDAAGCKSIVRRRRRLQESAAGARRTLGRPGGRKRPAAVLMISAMANQFRNVVFDGIVERLRLPTR